MDFSYIMHNASQTLTEPPDMIELFIHFFINSSEPFTWKARNWLGVQGDPGWRVKRFEGSVTLGASQLFLI